MSYFHKIENILIKSRQFRLPGKKELWQTSAEEELVVMDVMESQIERPLKRQKQLIIIAQNIFARGLLYNELKLTGLPVDGKCLDGVQPVVETGSGGQTKYNRYRLNLPKTHWLDAACVGVLDQLYVENHQPLLISAKGHGTRQICRTNKYGFPIRHCSRTKIHKGFQTGDIVKAIVKSHQRQENRNLYRTSCYSKNWVI